VLAILLQKRARAPHAPPPPHTHLFNGPFSGTTRVRRYQKGNTNLDFTEARDSEWQWQQLGHIQVCTLLQTDNHASTPPLSFLQARCPSCCPTNSVKALKALQKQITLYDNYSKHGKLSLFYKKQKVVAETVSEQNLHLAASHQLTVPPHRQVTYGGRAFAVASPSTCNSLPIRLHDPSFGTSVFGRLLKTLLFSEY